MIQRIQSVWLLLAAIFDAITFRLPFYNGDWLKDKLPNYPVDLNAQTTILLTIVTFLSAGLAFAAIFLFGNRRLQLKLVYAGLALSIVSIVLYFLEMQNFVHGAIALWCIFPFAIVALYILAIRGISHDKKLIKSLDRLR